MISKRTSVQFGRRNIEFFVKRSRRRRTISLFVDPYDGVFLRAPAKPSLKILSRLVHSKAVWILDKQRRINENLEYLPRREFVTGESFLYLGRPMRLKVLQSDKGNKITAGEGRFLAGIDGRRNRAGKTRELLYRWYKKHAKVVLQKRVAVYSGKLKIPASEVILAEQAKRWGSCNSKGSIRFNWRIIMAPMSLIDYVVAHELCHLKYINHSTNFWRLLGSVRPDYDDRRERLRKEGQKYYF